MERPSNAWLIFAAVMPIPDGPIPLAHQGGWDEILLVVAPLAIIGLLLWVANRRVTAQIAAQSTDTPVDEASRAKPTGGDGDR